MALDNQLKELLDASQTFRKCFGLKTLSLDDVGVDSNTLQPTGQGIINEVLLPNEVFLGCRTDAPLGVSCINCSQRFGSGGNPRFTIYGYTIFLPSSPSVGSQWFGVFHELGHLFLQNHHLIRQEHPQTLKTDSFEVEADFFARLCFWPLESIAQGFEEKGKKLTYYELVDYLARYAMNELIAVDKTILESEVRPVRLRIRLGRQAHHFLQTMKAMLPNYYQSFIGRILKSNISISVTN